MKERPILFSGAMVLAILQGKKQQTRRIVKGVDECAHGYDEVKHVEGAKLSLAGGGTVACPYGSPGDRLWVRETFGHAFDAGDGQLTVLMPSGKATQDALRRTVYRATANVPENVPIRWTPSIHMPRRASRILLEVRGVRAERLQDITDEDAAAEGCESTGHPSPVDNYMRLWNSLNAKRGYGWSTNPWVWVVEFRKAS